MHPPTIPFQLQLPDQVSFAFSLLALAQRLERLSDRRKPQGVRYLLPVLLTIAVLAKLAGQSRREPMADWARLRATELARRFGLKRVRMPHQSTWSRVLGQVVDSEEGEHLLGQFFGEAQQRGTENARGSIVLAVDGKTLRGTIPAGHGSGVHLVAAYLPAVGVVLAQLAVDRKKNEIVVVPKLLATLDLTGVVGLAMRCKPGVR